jgi:hypothetical protein
MVSLVLFQLGVSSDAVAQCMKSDGVDPAMLPELSSGGSPAGDQGQAFPGGSSAGGPVSEGDKGMPTGGEQASGPLSIQTGNASPQAVAVDAKYVKYLNLIKVLPVVIEAVSYSIIGHVNKLGWNSPCPRCIKDGF